MAILKTLAHSYKTRGKPFIYNKGIKRTTKTKLK